MVVDLGNYDYTHIVHIADVHIPVKLYLDRREEYSTVFESFISQLRLLQHRYIIVIAGDLLDRKLSLEPETIQMATTFLKNLSSLAPTLLIAGNHDCDEKNPERLDSLSVIAPLTGVTYLKQTGVYRLGHLHFVISSLLDKKFLKRSDVGHIDGPVYAIYHGALIGSHTDGNITIKECETSSTRFRSKEDFSEFTAVLLGDIHRHQYLSPTIAYSGSLVQKNFGEATDKHGFILWNTSDHSSSFHEVPNSFVFLTLFVYGGDYDSSDLDKHKHHQIRLRIRATGTSDDQIRDIENDLREKYSLHQVVIEKRGHVPIIDAPKMPEVDDSALISELTLYPQHLPVLLHLHKVYSKNQEPITHTQWSIKSLRFRGLYAYGSEWSEITLVPGVTNLCAPNASGKTSLLNVIISGIYGRTQGTVIHNGLSKGEVMLNLIVDGIEYRIHRSFSLTSPKMLVKLYREGVDVGQPTERETQRVINDLLGDMDTFLMYNLISPRHGLSIIHLHPRDRIEALSQLCSVRDYSVHEELAASDRKAMYNKRRSLAHKRDTIHIPKDRCEEIKDIEVKISDGEFCISSIRQKLGKLQLELKEVRDKLFQHQKEWKDVKQPSMLIANIKKELESIAVPANDCDHDFLWKCRKQLGEREEVPESLPETASPPRSLIDLQIRLREINSIIQPKDEVHSVTDGVVPPGNWKVEHEILRRNIDSKMEIPIQPTEDCEQLEDVPPAVNLKEWQDKAIGLRAAIGEFPPSNQDALNIVKSLVFTDDVSEITKRDADIIESALESEHSGGKRLSLESQLADLETKIAEGEKANSRRKEIIDGNKRRSMVMELHRKWNEYIANQEKITRLAEIEGYLEIESAIDYSKRMASWNAARSEREDVVRDLATWKLIDDINKRNAIIDREEERDRLDNLMDGARRAQLERWLLDWQNYSSQEARRTIVKDLKESENDVIKSVDEANIDLSRYERDQGGLIERLRLYRDEKDVREEGLTQKEKLNSTIAKLDSKILIQDEYLRLMHRDVFPLRQLQDRVKSVSKSINDIFHDYTGYRFDLIVTKCGKINPAVYHGDIRFDPSSLSGYESLTLQLAVSQVALPMLPQASHLLLVDEAFDCIDGKNFEGVLPKIVNQMRRAFSSLVLISHRDLSFYVSVDQDLTIHNKIIN